MKINIDYKKGKGLIPAIIQEKISGKVLMLGFMDKEALKNTKQTGFVWFWSRSRKRLWKKGEISGNMLRVKKILIDCDQDSLLVLVELVGKCVCHTGKYSCFYTFLGR